MPTIEAFPELQTEVTEWRRDLHANPELNYDVHRTAALVAERLNAFGCDKTISGIGRTGVVGIIRGKADSRGRVIGLRADMDALPIQETTGCPTPLRFPARCMRAGTTAIPQCFSAQPSVSRRRVISTGPRWSFSSQPKRAALAARRCVMTD